MSEQTDVAREHLRALDRRLRELVAVAGDRDSNLGSVWKDCEEIGRGIADIAAATHSASPDDKALLVDDMSSLCEFYAIATEFLQREKASIAELLHQVHKAQQGLTLLSSGDELGESCDIAG